jgi:ADP-dependent NAD(P)H-hydrate dehydratase / NAD(P)H-hydrate epimerase
VSDSKATPRIPEKAIPLVSVAEMRALEGATMRGGVSEAQLMETAGTAVADAIAGYLPRTQGRRIVALVGRGNNGGDALIAARVLVQRYGARAQLYLVTARAGDPLLETALAAGAELLVHARGTLETLRGWLGSADVVLDGILGIGQRLPLEGAIADVLDVVASRRPGSQRRIAVDVPTGVDADTGAADRRAFMADLTLATGPAKPGLFIHPGAEAAGRVQPLEIGLRDAPEGQVALTTAGEVAQLLPPRRDDSHKGTYGKVLVVAGSDRYIGAAYLSAAAAVRSGAGLVTLAAPPHVRDALSGRTPETTFLPLPDDPAAPGRLTPGHLGTLLDAALQYDALAIGPGLGPDKATRRLVTLLMAELAAAEEGPRVLIDADGLNALATAPEWRGPAAPRWVVTPHPGEMARLVGVETGVVQGSRLTLAREKSEAWGQVVILKGAPSIISHPDGRTRLNVFANAALAVGGTGDVLSGVTAGLMAQGLAPFEAAVAGSYVHALAGELWRAEHGEAGLAASSLAEHVPEAMHRLRRR